MAAATTTLVGFGLAALSSPAHPEGPLPGPRADHTLARDLGGMTVHDLRRRMSVREFVDWACLYHVENEEREAAARRNRK